MTLRTVLEAKDMWSRSSRLIYPLVYASALPSSVLCRYSLRSAAMKTHRCVELHAPSAYGHAAYDFGAVAGGTNSVLSSSDYIFRDDSGRTNAFADPNLPPDLYKSPSSNDYAYIQVSVNFTVGGGGHESALDKKCEIFRLISRPTPRLLSFALCLEWINGRPIYNTPDTRCLECYRAHASVNTTTPKIDRKHINCRTCQKYGHDIYRENSK